MQSLTKHFQERIILLLSDYVRNPSGENISKLSLGMNSNMVLENLDIREDLLLMNGIPLVINEGKINRIQITVPTLFKTMPARIDVENVMIRVRLLVEQRGNDDMMKLMSKIKTTFNSDRTFGSGSYKEQKLKDWEDKMMKYFKELAPPTWIKKIIDNILKNMIISIKNLNIYYESFSLLSSPSLAKISLQELNLHSTHDNWTPGFNSNPKIQFRELFIKGLAVTLNINKKKAYDISGDIPFKKEAVHKSKTSPTAPRASKKPLFQTTMPHSPMNKTKHIAFEETDDLEADYKKLRENDVYLLFPLDLSIRIKTELDLSKDFENDPQKLVLVDVKESIILMLNKDHMRFLGALNEHLRLMNIVQKNLHLRPIEPPKRRLKEWWKYAVRAVLEERKRQSDFSKDPGSLMKMKKYIDLYKRQQGIISVPWLPRITEKERPTFKKLEEDIPLQNLIQFREWAFIEIRVEAKRFATLNKDVQGMKPLIDVWFHILNNDDMFKSNSKDNMADTIRLTPLEQTDLYEILALDKAKVLESYLKGENNDPKDISMNLKMNLSSFYIMISEPKWSSNPFKRASSVRTWWTQPNVLAGDMSGKITGESVISASHRHRGSPGGHSPTFQEFDPLPNLNTSSNKKGNHVSLKVQGREHDNDRSGLSMKSQSFRDHLKDIEREVESKYLVNETEDDNEAEEDHTEINVAQSYPLLSTWWNQNLILIFEILDITTSINKYRSGRLSTEGEKPLEFGSIMVTTAFNLPKATKYRKSKASSEGNGLQYEHLLQNILAYDFNSVPSVGQRDANPFIAYLKSSGFVNLASFLEVFEKDKRNSGEVIINNLKAYRPFFNEGDPLHIEQLREVKRKFENYMKFSSAIKETKERIIFEAYEEVEQHILKNLLPPFLFSHGILVLPLILQANTSLIRDPEATTASKGIEMVFKTLKNVGNQVNSLGKSFLGKMTKKMASQELTDTPLNLFFDIEGRESKFKIKKIDMPTSKLHTPNLFGRGLMVDLIDEKEPNEGQSFIKLNVQPIIIHLSIESLKPLIIFVKSFSQNSHSDQSQTNQNEAEAASVRDYEKMIDCIHYNKDREKEIQAEEGPRLEARFSMITIKVSNFIPNYRQERELCFSFRDILYKVKNPNSSELAPSLETKRLQTYYRAKSLRVEEILLEEVVNAGPDTYSINILRAGIIFYFYECLFKNHPLYTDSKIHALIPFFNLIIDDGALLFLQTIKLTNILLSNLSQKTAKMPSRTKKGAAGEDIVMGTNQRNMLINRFKVLRNDHKESNKACKHCILRYKKSQTVLNLFFGDLGKYCSTLIATPFHNLYSVLEKDSLSKKMDQGLTISLCHSLSSSEDKVYQTLLYIPFLSVTRDQGFFKDNLIVHCTESSKPGREGQGKDSIDFKIRPMIKVTNQFMANLDEKFWRYFKDFEKFYRNKDDKQKMESMVSVEQSNSSSIKSDKMEGEKLFSIEGEGSSEKDIEEKEPDSRPKVYMLFARKKILLKDLAMQFEIGETDFRNFLVLKLREINIRFNSFRSFCCLKYTMDAFSYLNTWFDHFLSSMSITKAELSRVGSHRPAESGMTLTSVDNLIENEDIAVMIEKISLLVKIKPPQLVWFFEINQVCLETGKKIQGGTQQELSDEQIWELFSISHINGSFTSSSSGTIRNILLRYHKDLQQIKFSVDNVHHSCPSRTDHSLIRIPSNSAVSVEKKALKASLEFSDGLLSNVNVIISSIGVYVSKILVVEEMCGIDVYNTLLLQEKENLPELLASTVFQKVIFDEIEQTILKSAREKEVPSLLQQTSHSKIGPFEAAHGAMIIVNVENANAKLLTDNHILFAELDIAELEFQRDLEGQYEVTCTKFGVYPRNSYYSNFIVDMAPAYPMAIRMYKNKEEDSPVLHIQNSKIIYLERVIAEIKAFQRGIQKEIETASQKISQVTVTKPQTDLKNYNKTGVSSRSVMFKLQLDNSCIVVPRDSKSQDVFIALFERVDATIESDVRSINFPDELKKPLAVINNKLVVDTSLEYHKKPCAVTVVNANIAKLDLLYINEGLKRAIGSSELAFIISTTPKSPMVVNQWNFDAALQAVLEQFTFSMNAACLIEIDDLVSQNLKETSDVFKFRARDLARTKLLIGGRELQLDMNRSTMEAAMAEEIRARNNQTRNPDQNQNEKEEWPHKRV